MFLNRAYYTSLRVQIYVDAHSKEQLVWLRMHRCVKVFIL